MVKTLPPNVALGAMKANQEEYDRDAPKLLNAAHRFKPLFTFGSLEPIMGPIKLNNHTAPDWIIVGGECGRGAGPMVFDWARSLRDQSRELGRVFNFKQTGVSSGLGSDMLDGKQHIDQSHAGICEQHQSERGSSRCAFPMLFGSNLVRFFEGRLSVTSWHSSVAAPLRSFPVALGGFARPMF